MRRIVKVEKIFHRVPAALAIIQCDKRQGEERIRFQPPHLDSKKAYPRSKREPLPQPPVRDGINKNRQQDAHETIIHAEPDPAQEWGGGIRVPHQPQSCTGTMQHSAGRAAAYWIPAHPQRYSPQTLSVCFPCLLL